MERNREGGFKGLPRGAPGGSIDRGAAEGAEERGVEKK